MPSLRDEFVLRQTSHTNGFKFAVLKNCSHLKVFLHPCRLSIFHCRCRVSAVATSVPRLSNCPTRGRLEGMVGDVFAARQKLVAQECTRMYGFQPEFASQTRILTALTVIRSRQFHTVWVCIKNCLFTVRKKRGRNLALNEVSLFLPKKTEGYKGTPPLK